MLSLSGYARSIIIVFLVSTGALVVLLPRSAGADSMSSLDGLGSKASCQVRHCLAQSITTSQSNDVIIATLGDGYNVSQLTDSSGLTFIQRLSYTQPTHNLSLWEFYAVAPSPLSSDNVSAIVCCSPKAGMQLIAIHGADLGSIFDSNPSVPATVSCTFDGRFYSGPSCGHCLASGGDNGPCSASILTSRVDFVVATILMNDADPCRGGNSTSPAANQPPIGFKSVAFPSSDFEVEINQTSTAGATVTFNCYGTDVEAIILDAIALGDSSTASTISWQGYDWDGAGEENVTLNGQAIASLPATDTPQNGGNWANFSVYSGAIVQGENTLTFTHANWDCATFDNVQNLQITNGSSTVYSNSTSLPLDCTQSLTYTFTV